MSARVLRTVLLLTLLSAGAAAFRKRHKGTDRAEDLLAHENQEHHYSDDQDATLRERSVSMQSLTEATRVNLDKTVVSKGDPRRRRAPPRRRRAIPCVGAFSGWSACSVNCGGGTQSKTYHITQHASAGGGNCPYGHGHVENQACNTHACPVHCVGSWSSFGACSATCGGGEQTRTFTVSTPAQHGGQPCSSRHGETQKQSCNAQACAIDCVGSWGSFDACSVTCGGGEQTRTFTVSTAAQHGGKSCSSQHGETQSQPCNAKACPMDCVGAWGEFGKCTKTCGRGQQFRSYAVSTTAKHGGKACPHNDGERREQACNTDACPVDCQGSWSPFTECSTTCGEGTQTRTFSVDVAQQHGGAACPNPDGHTESKSCNPRPCFDVVGEGKCLSCWHEPQHEFKFLKGHKCEDLCAADAKCCAYSKNRYNNCILWTQCDGLSGGGDYWGGAKCHVKDGYKDLPCPMEAQMQSMCPEWTMHWFGACYDQMTWQPIDDSCCTHH